MINRRDFFKRGMQLSMLAGLLGGSAYLVSRNGVGQDCSQSQMCINCSKLKNCSLEKAEKFKENDREKRK